MPDPAIVNEVVGEGKTDHGRGGEGPGPPTAGVVPVIVHRLCDRPASMLVKRRPLPFLQGKGLWQKVRFAKRQAFNSGSAGLVFVLDTEGNHPAQLEQLLQGRDAGLVDYPTAVGVTHPCIEAWLLADAAAIARALSLAGRPEVPEAPESLPAPAKDRDRNPKAVLGRCCGQSRTLSSAETTRIALEIRDLAAIRDRCPISFAPFADEVLGIIGPLFEQQAGSIDPPAPSPS